jgi:hypothetical protein
MFAVQACRVICSSRQEQKMRSTNFTPGNNNGYLPMAKLELQLSIMTLLSLLMGVWQNVCKELTVLLMLPNKLLQILLLDFYTL